MTRSSALIRVARWQVWCSHHLCRGTSGAVPVGNNERDFRLRSVPARCRAADFDEGRRGVADGRPCVCRFSRVSATTWPAGGQGGTARSGVARRRGRGKQFDDAGFEPAQIADRARSGHAIYRYRCGEGLQVCGAGDRCRTGAGGRGRGGGAGERYGGGDSAGRATAGDPQSAIRSEQFCRPDRENWPILPNG